MLLVRHPRTYPVERAYVLDVVLREFMGLEWEARAEERADAQITVPRASDDARIVIADCLFATPEPLWLTRGSLPERPLAHWSLDDETPLASTLITPDLPVVYGKRLAAGSFYEESGGEIQLGVDIFGSIFFQLTRYEEIAEPSRDAHDRFPAGASLAHAEGFLTRPLVNEYVEVLWTALRRLWPRLQRKRHTFEERLSHDVDWPLHAAVSPPRMAKSAIGDLVRRHDSGLALARLRAARAHRRGDPAGDPYNTFDFIMDLSERRGLRSAFYFMAGATNPAFDGTYSLEDPWIGKLIRQLHDRGHEIGLHPSYETFRDPDAIRAERDALVHACARLGVEQSEWGGRQHYLRWENPTTWSAWEQAGLTYDSSLGFSHDPGFRCGVCFEYPVFDLSARRRLMLRERPLVVMEMALFHDSAKSDRRGLETVEQLRDRCKLFGGDFTLLWHNSQLASRRERRLYASALTATTA
jgi:hypothetical protein